MSGMKEKKGMLGKYGMKNGPHCSMGNKTCFVLCSIVCLSAATDFEELENGNV